MEEKEVKVKQPQRTNYFELEGALRENALEVVTDKKGQKVIRGKITIAVDAVNSHSVRFYVPEKKSDGTPNKSYTEMLSMLPNNTLSIANYLSTNPTADFKTAYAGASKMWCKGRMEEYVDFKDGKERSMITLQGFILRFKSQDGSPLKPRAVFSCEVYIEKIVPEYKGEEETGRYVLYGVTPRYDGRAMRFSFIAPAEDGAADYIKENCNPSDTMTFNGDMINMKVEEKEPETPASSNGFGRVLSLDSQIRTTFVKENIIKGGNKLIPQGEPGCITTAAVKDGLAQRLVAAQENSEKGKAEDKGSQKKPATNAQTAQVGFGRQVAAQPAQDNEPHNGFELDNSNGLELDGTELFDF